MDMIFSLGFGNFELPPMVIWHWVCRHYKVYTNDDLRLTLTY